MKKSILIFLLILLKLIKTSGIIASDKHEIEISTNTDKLTFGSLKIPLTGNNIMLNEISKPSDSSKAHDFIVGSLNLVDCQNLIKMNKTLIHKDYGITLVCDKKGLNVSFNYDVNKIDLKYNHIILNHKTSALIFKFINKPLLEQIKTLGDMVIRVSNSKHNHKNETIIA